MTLDEFIEEQKRTLEAFRDHWRQMQKLAPGRYPGELESGDWDMQLQMFDIPVEAPSSPRRAQAGYLLTRETALLDMICTDPKGMHVVIDQIRKDYAEVGFLTGNTITFSGEGSLNIPYEDLTFSGQFYSPRSAPARPHGVSGSSQSAKTTLTSQTAEIHMICTDIDGNRVVIDRLIDHKYAEVGVWSGSSFSFDGSRVRLDEMVFTGEFYEIPAQGLRLDSSPALPK